LTQSGHAQSQALARYKQSSHSGVDGPDAFRRSAVFVHKILQGTKPADLPVEQPTKFELVVNLKTAKALDVKISESVLLRADKLIE
jgi:ABC-type uncharacterized transport system substrate-binding protein